MLTMSSSTEALALVENECRNASFAGEHSKVPFGYRKLFGSFGME